MVCVMVCDANLFVVIRRVGEAVTLMRLLDASLERALEDTDDQAVTMVVCTTCLRTSGRYAYLWCARAFTYVVLRVSSCSTTSWRRLPPTRRKRTRGAARAVTVCR
jgi:hypothetical protein